MAFFGLFLVLFGLYLLNQNFQDIKILKRFKTYGNQAVKVKILRPYRPFLRNINHFRLDKSLEHIFICKVYIEGCTRVGLFIGTDKTPVGEEIFVRGIYYPTSSIMVPENDFIVEDIRKFFIPFILPGTIIKKK